MSKHTPGPWEAQNGEVTTPRENGRSYRRIAAVQDYGAGSLKEVDDANARLMAAAPDMLKVLIQLTTEWERGREWISEDTIDQATRAIAKATSQQ